MVWIVLLEVNFERDPTMADAFSSTDPMRIFNDLALLRDHRAAPADSLLFLDEIQSAPEVLARLRWFAEELTELPVVAAGPLLEFAHSMPLGFPEYLDAHGQQPLPKRMSAWRPGGKLAVVASLGAKFVYASVGDGVKAPAARRALEMLSDARLCRLIPHTAANAMPLAAQQNERMRKAVLLDVGIDSPRRR